jgi:predicted nuclease of predicted toxin-antitoxin system
MRIKLDENLGARSAEMFRLAGFETTTVLEQKLCSSPDRALIEICRAEKRCLITLDLGFGNPMIFKPADYFGIAVLRLPSKTTPVDLIDAVRTLIGGLTKKDIEGRLWIVQRGRIREYQPEE